MPARFKGSALLAMVCGLAVVAQDDRWSHVLQAEWGDLERGTPNAALTAEQQQSIVTLLRSGQPPWSCDYEPEDQWWNKLRYSSLPLSAANRVILVEAGQGCARGGQGSNGAMWLVWLGAREVRLLTPPEAGFSGFVYSVEPAVRNGYRDVVAGWHRSAFETGLTYFQFDGTGYRPIAGTIRCTDYDTGVVTVSPDGC